ncbi:hypothetical protein DFH09DRAFT_1080003, partial [Mycena vulgaris]
MSSSAQSPAFFAPALLDFGPIATPRLIGSLLNFFLSGILVVQVYVYCVCFPNDQRSIKALVCFVVLAMAVCICLNAQNIVLLYGAGFGDIARFTDVHNRDAYTPILVSVIATLVQLFFCYRILLIRRSVWPLAVLIGLIAMGQCVGGMAMGIRLYIKYGVNDVPMKDFGNLWLAAAAAADILIAATMTALVVSRHPPLRTPLIFTPALQRIRRPRHARRAPRRYAPGDRTNMLTATVALLVLILFLGVPGTTYYLFPSTILPGIYANTLLATLNNRAVVRLGAADDTAISFSASMQVGFSAGSGATHADFTDANLKTRASTGSVLSLPAICFASRAVPGCGEDGAGSENGSE